MLFLDCLYNCIKTLAEMSDEERANRNDGRTSATTEFINWYKEMFIDKKDTKAKIKQKCK